MRSHLVRLWTSLFNVIAPSRSARSTKSASLAIGGLERLEERTVPSGLWGRGFTPSACTCPNCVGGAAYTLGGGVAGNSPYAVKWPQPGGLGSPVTITYSYSNLLDGRLGGGLSAAAIKSAVQEALGRWASVSPLRFVEVRDAGPAVSTADYNAAGKPMIRLGHRPVDGGYGILAYGYYPGVTGLAGDLQIDTSERWSTSPGVGVDLIEVVTHELGHTLGLSHSQASQSIMAPMYGGYFRGPGTSFLYPDDINGVRALYGAGRGSVTPLVPVVFPNQTFTVIGNTLHVRGTAGNDVFDVNLGTAVPRIAVNGREFTGSLAGIRSINVVTGTGQDVAVVRGSAQAETITTQPGKFTLTGPTRNLTITGCKAIDVVGGAGDSAVMIGSTGADVLVTTPTSARFQGPGFSYMLRWFASVRVVGQAGTDTAHMYDSAGDDTFVGSPGVGRLQGAGYVNVVSGFERVRAYASAGLDSARLTDSAGNDVFQAGPGVSTLSGPANVYQLTVQSFERVSATASAGRDVAWLYDTVGNDTFLATPTYSVLYSGDFRFEASNFEQVSALSSFGTDEVYVYDSAGNDTLSVNNKTATLYMATSLVQFTNFSYASLYGTTGGVNRRPPGALPFRADWYGSWM